MMYKEWDKKRLDELTFDQLFELMRPEMMKQAHKHHQKFRHCDIDDIFQELSIKLWQSLKKVPKDIEYFDFRFISYYRKTFSRHILTMYSGRLYSQSILYRKQGIAIPRDELDRANRLPMNISVFM